MEDVKNDYLQRNSRTVYIKLSEMVQQMRYENRELAG